MLDTRVWSPHIQDGGGGSLCWPLAAAQPGGDVWGLLSLGILPAGREEGCQVVGMGVRAGQAWSPHGCFMSSDSPLGPPWENW